MRQILYTSFFLLNVFITTFIYAQETGTFTDSRDGYAYKWVKIEDQTWMAENLAYLPSVNRVDDGLFEGKCYYIYGYDGRDISEAKLNLNFKKYGVLYNWEAACESCPEGWHLPTDEEWKKLEKHLGMEDEINEWGWRRKGRVGDKLKSLKGWKAGGGTDNVGFNLVPGGCRGYGGYGSIGFCAYLWTASPAGGDNGWRRGFCGDDSGSCREQDRKYFGVSVRCVKD